jgi:hypothetical protein
VVCTVEAGSRTLLATGRCLLTVPVHHDAWAATPAVGALAITFAAGVLVITIAWFPERACPPGAGCEAGGPSHGCRGAVACGAPCGLGGHGGLWSPGWRGVGVAGGAWPGFGWAWVVVCCAVRGWLGVLARVWAWAGDRGRGMVGLLSFLRWGRGGFGGRAGVVGEVVELDGGGSVVLAESLAEDLDGLGQEQCEVGWECREAA